MPALLLALALLWPTTGLARLEYSRVLPVATQQRHMLRLLRSTLDNVHKYGRWDSTRPGGRLAPTK